MVIDGMMPVMRPVIADQVIASRCVCINRALNFFASFSVVTISLEGAIFNLVSVEQVRVFVLIFSVVGGR